MQPRYEWRGDVRSAELNVLHAEAFETRVFTDEEWDWERQLATHSFGWALARGDDGTLLGFVNVVSDGVVHAWLQDLMVSRATRSAGIGRELVTIARAEAAAGGHEYLHVDFDDELRGFYFDVCGFRPTNAGLIELA